MELELESGREFLATKNRRSRRCQELEFRVGVGERSCRRERRPEAGEPTGAREHVCGPSVILTASVKGAREISAGRSPLAKQVARAVRARQNHAGGVPANCGSGEQVGRRPLAFGRRQQAKLARSEVGGGAKVRANGYGVFAEAP